MKLKKIASLALAGVMAVSMLAGCGTQEPAPNPGEGEGQGTVTTTGFSATLEDAVDTKRDDITFADNAADQAALEKVVAGLSTETVEAIAKNWIVPTDLTSSTRKDAVEAAANIKTELNVSTHDVSYQMFKGCMPWFAKAEHHEINSVGIRTGVVYAFNGGVNTSYALNTIAEAVADVVEAAPESSTDTANGTAWDYTYTVSASVVTRDQQSNYTGVNNNTTFVLVTLTRTVTNAKV